MATSGGAPERDVYAGALTPSLSQRERARRFGGTRESLPPVHHRWATLAGGELESAHCSDRAAKGLDLDALTVVCIIVRIG